MSKIYFSIRSRLAVALSLVTVLCSFVWFVSYGSGDLIGSKPEVWGTAYDYLAQSLLILRADVPAEAIGLEGIQNKGKTFLYFGPFPALLRLILNYFFPDNFGHWSRLSCLLAAILSFSTCIYLTYKTLSKNDNLNNSTRVTVLISMIVAIGLGSPLLFLLSDSMIFLEAILWGLCFSILGMLTLFAYMLGESSNTRTYLFLGLYASLALLSRVTFALPLYIILFYLMIRELSTSFRSKSLLLCLSRLFILALPGLTGIIVQLWYNWARFGSPFRSLVYQMVSPNPSLYGGEFNALRIPVSIYNFLWINSASISLAPPYFHSVKPAFLSPRLYTEWVERVIPLTMSAPWLVLLAAVGACLLLQKKVKNDWKVFFIAFFAQTLLILSWHFLTQRYIGDTLPLLLFLTMFALLRLQQSKIQKLALITVPLISLSVLATPLSTIDFHLRAIGDTGEKKTNRPLLNKLFYSIVDYPASNKIYAFPISQPPNSQFACALPTQETIRGRMYQTVFSLIQGCSLSLNINQGNSTVMAIIALSDQSHACEGGSANLQIRDQSGFMLYHSSLLRQTDKPQVIEFQVKEPTNIQFIFENMTLECLRGFVINPILS